jgi:hypothetical protein
MAGTQVRVEGAAELAASLHRAANELDHLDAAHSRVGGFVAAQAGRAAPRRTGRLASSVRVLGSTGKDVTVGSSLVYAGVIHYGWPRRGIAANPFLVVPAERTMPTWSDFYYQAVVGIVGRIHGR